ncbi:MAG: hypothetical protein M1305_07165 [Candidatus Marsarchaeota archaeon]|nr:hypothetical protein [Candidatus Marsarchaeota archaeon]
MDRANEFILLYNEISDYLRQIAGPDGSDNFSELVDRAARDNSAVRREAARLKAYGRFRNAIIHYRTYPEEIIAEPTEETLTRFRDIVQKVLSPKGLIPTFQKEIQCFSPNEPLITALRYMGDNDFSQVVVRGKDGLSLLTAEGVAKWLAQRAQNQVINVSLATIAEANGCEACSGFTIMSQNRTVYDAHEAFTSALERQQPRLFAIIITDSGRPTEQPIGLVTPWDLLGDGE